MKRDAARLNVREILRDFYDIDTVGTGGINSSSESLPVNNADRYNIGDVLTVESEMMKVRGIDSATKIATVTRGFHLSTAAAHVITKTIIINPEFSDRALNLCLDLAVGDTFLGFEGIWIETVVETLTSTSAREYTIPAGLADIARIQIQDDDGFFQESREWETVGSKIKFNRDLDIGKTIRVIGTSFQSLLTDDTTESDLSAEQMQFVIYDAAWHALQQRFGHRIKATEYNASVNERAGQPLEMIQMVGTLRNTVAALRAREFKPRMSRFKMGRIK